MGKLFNQWIATLDKWEERVTDFPHYPNWLSVIFSLTFSLAGAVLVFTFGILLLINAVSGLSALLRPLQPVGEVLGAIVAGLMVFAIILFLLFLLHAILVLIAYTCISLTRGILKSILTLAHAGR